MSVLLQTPPKPRSVFSCTRAPEVREVRPRSETDAPEILTEILTLPNQVENERAGNFAFVLRGFLSPAECAEMVAESERRGYEPALLNTGRGQILDTSTRNSQRNIMDSEEAAGSLFERLRPHLPETLDGRRCTGLNGRLRFLRYDPGEYFAPHYDGCYSTPDGAEASMLTVMLYLNAGGGADFTGGETNFLHRWDQSPEKGTAVVPGVGDVLVFTHNILHEGAAVEKGRKYAVRTDVMFESTQQRFMARAAQPRQPR